MTEYEAALHKRIMEQLMAKLKHKMSAAQREFDVIAAIVERAIEANDFQRAFRYICVLQFLAARLFSRYRFNYIKKMVEYPPLGVMLVGATGSGKSSTLNALLSKDAAKVGYGPNPETKSIQVYPLNDYIHLYDTPGLGDGVKEDKDHIEKIAGLLKQGKTLNNGHQKRFIDRVLVLIDGSNRDLGVVSRLLKNAILKNIDHSRVLFVINQADIAMKGRHWDGKTPDAVLSDFLEKKSVSVQQRIQKEIGVKIKKPLCYSATEGFNLLVLLDFIIESICPGEK